MTEGTAPKWILGEDADLAEWLVHLHEPRFCCRVRSGAEFTAAQEESAEEQFIYFFDGEDQSLTEFVWLGAAPGEAELQALLAGAADFIEAMSDV